MDTTIWGPPFWFILHTISINYPEKLRAKKDFYLMPTCRVWGWATLKDRWENHIKSTKKLDVGEMHFYLNKILFFLVVELIHEF